MKLPRIPYWPLLVGPQLLFAFGFLLNAFVMGINHGQMPVLWPGGVCDSSNFIHDTMHSCMNQSTHLKFLADWIVIKGLGVASPGDFFEWAFESIVGPCYFAWVALIIKNHNEYRG